MRTALILIALVVALAIANNGAVQTTPVFAPGVDSTPKASPQRIGDKMELDFTWRRGGFNTVAVITFTIDNRNDYAVKDVDIECEFFAPSGTRVDRNEKTIFERIPAKKKQHIAELSFGFISQQAKSAVCSIGNAQRA